MRSLEKLALEKGLVAPSEDSSVPVVKTASKKELKPTNNIDADIAALCDGLRAKGFKRYADEVESKFFALKTAESSGYNVILETGEDLVNAFHPEGSVRIKGVEGDATVETILDQRKIIEKIIAKKPTGKL